MSIDLITPDTYRAKRRYRRLADKVMKRAEVDYRDVARIERHGDKFEITVFLKDADDHPFVIAERVVCSRIVVVTR